MITLASPVRRSQSRSLTVARLPGSTARSAAATARGSVVTCTSTPGSAASASASVPFDILGSRTTATRNAPTVRTITSPARHLERVLSVQPDIGKPRQHASERYAGPLRELLQPGLQNPGIAAKFVDQEGLYQPPILIIKQRHRPKQGSKDAATIDIADDHDRQVLGPS